MPFPKLNAAETSSKLKICRIIKMYCEIISVSAKVKFGKAMGIAK
jgi:hypothetical protein